MGFVWIKIFTHRNGDYHESFFGTFKRAERIWKFKCDSAEAARDRADLRMYRCGKTTSYVQCKQWFWKQDHCYVSGAESERNLWRISVLWSEGSVLSCKRYPFLSVGYPWKCTYCGAYQCIKNACRRTGVHHNNYIWRTYESNASTGKFYSVRDKGCGRGYIKSRRTGKTLSGAWLRKKLSGRNDGRVFGAWRNFRYISTDRR